jgi:TonB-linked SusC/RagA family outer membrane protein
MPGVNILVEGTKTGAISDASGKYTINIPNENAVLIISFIGYASQKAPVNGRTVIDIKLVPSLANLEEVVVVGYGTQKKVNVTGSVATVSSSELKSLPVKDVGTALVGRLPGIIAVNTGGVPGQNSPNISIRGYESMLVIVDGVEYPFGWDQLEMTDIESISVLKDASAAIYGARAGNGVLLITTKRGQSDSGPAKFNFSASYGIESPIRQLHAVDAATLATMENEANVGTFTPEQIQKYRDGSDPAYPNTNWLNEVFNKTAPIQHYNLSSMGGNEKINYFYSLGYFQNDGLLKSGDINFNRFNFRSNIEAKIARGLTASFDISGRQEKLTGPGAVASTSGDINALYQNVLQLVNCSQPFYPAHYPDPTKLAFAGHGSGIPLGAANKDYAGYTNDDNKYISAAVSVKYDVPTVKGLSARARFSTDQQFSYTKQFAKAFYYYMYDPETKTYSAPLPAQTEVSDRESAYRQYDYTSQFQANYDKTIGNHTFNVMALAEYNSSGNISLMGFRKNYVSSAVEQLFAGGDKDKDATGQEYQDGRIGYAGRLNYEYAGKYLLESTIRYDGSSRYAPAKRWGTFPSLSLGWRLSEEPFLKNSPSINNLKLRATIGKSGFDAIDPYKYITGYKFGPAAGDWVTSGGAVFGNAITKGIYSTGIANPNLVWQTATEYNLGLDAGFLKNLISFELNLFYRKVTNVAGDRAASVPYTFGAGLPQEPINSYDNRGIELQVKHENTVGELRYSVSGQLTYARSKWIHFDEPTYPDAFTKARLQTSGQWRNRLFGYKALGLFQSQTEIDGWADQDGQGNVTIQPGDIKYEDFNKDGKIDGNDIHAIGKGFTPDMIFSMNFTLQYKGFELNALFQGASGFNSFFHQIPFENSTVPFEYMTDYWTPTNTGAKLPRLVAGEAINNQKFSSFWLKDATYLRLKSLTIGYTIPKNLCAKVHVSSCRIYVTGLNLFVLDKDQVIDPEAGNSWYSSGAMSVPTITNGMYPYPLMKNYQIGVDLQF